MPTREVRVREVKALTTRARNMRFVLVDDEGNEYTKKTAVDAAPYLLDAEAVEDEVPPEELFAKHQPFKQLVADDVESGDDTA